MDGKTIHPRIPKTYVKGMEDGRTARICCSNSISGCMRAINTYGGPYDIMFVHEIEDVENIAKNGYLIKPTEDRVFDVNRTGEYWITCSVKLKCTAKISIGYRFWYEHSKNPRNGVPKPHVKFKYLERYHTDENIDEGYNFEIKDKKLNYKILKAIQRGLYEGLSKYDLTVLDDEDSVVIKNNNYKHSSINDDLIEILPEFLDNNKAFKNIVENAIIVNKQYQVKDKEELKLLINKSIEVFGNECDLNWIDTSLITDMSGLFLNIRKFNGHIGNWDTSNVTNMRAMFEYAESFNQPIGNWDISNVKDMEGMFLGAKNFNQPIGNWNTSKVEDMSWMFYNTESFNQDISKWNVSKVEDKHRMFDKCPIKKEYKPKF